MNHIDAVTKIEKATGPRDLFPDGPDAPSTRTLFRTLALACHPDRFNGKPIHRRMNTAFQRLNELHTQLSAPPPLPRIGKWGRIVDISAHGAQSSAERAARAKVAEESANYVPLKNSLEERIATATRKKGGKLSRRERAAVQSAYDRDVAAAVSRITDTLNESAEKSGREGRIDAAMVKREIAAINRRRRESPAPLSIDDEVNSDE